MGVQRVHCRQRRQGADHQNIAVGKVNDAQDAVHHGVAERDQGIDASQHDAIDELLYECVQPIYPTMCSNYGYHPINELNCKNTDIFFLIMIANLSIFMIFNIIK
ncbi:Uncharacterised protein [Raoultella terrigena]|uniref:Uncharacterized protein n=1 Tax=Raoultella terrigena TaxID=577 RepID=A0A3P8KPW0_RAOTE|nr:Uncharacterised protein [Raoultella terrigena]